MASQGILKAKIPSLCSCTWKKLNGNVNTGLVINGASIYGIEVKKTKASGAKYIQCNVSIINNCMPKFKSMYT